MLFLQLVLMRVTRCVHKLVSALSTNQIVHDLLMQKYLIQIVKSMNINTTKTNNMYIYVLVFCFIKIEGTLTTTSTTVSTPIPPQKACATVQGTQVQWPSTTDRISSVPLCINSAKEIAYRECSNGEWGPEPECFYVQEEIPPQCPTGFFEFGEICYTFSPSAPFPSSCLFPDALPFLPFTYLIRDRLPEPVWVPVTRDFSNGLGFMRWVEAGTFYKKEYDKYNYKNNSLGKNCLIFDRHGQSTAVYCNEKHRRLCAYRKLHLLVNKACSTFDKCVQSDFSSKTTCFCKDKVQRKPAEFIEPYQNSLAINDEECNFGLERTPNGSYYWSTSNREIDYTYWSPEAVFGSTYVFGAVTPKGWVLREQQSECFLVERQVEESEVRISLSIDNLSKYFIVSITNPFWLLNWTSNVSVICFTDAKSDNLLHRYDILDFSGGDINATATFLPVEVFPGYYWCEGFRFSNSEVIQSEKIFFRDQATFEFVGIFEVVLPQVSFDPLSANIMSYLNGVLLYALNITIDDTLYIPRIMKIVWFDEQSNTMVVNVHFSSNLTLDDTTSTEKEYQYSRLYASIESILAQIRKVKLTSFLSTDFCMAQDVCYRSDFCLKWPTVLASTVTAPVKFCFRTDGNPVRGFCGGNFTDGVYLMTFVSDCKILETSQLSDDIFPIYNNQESITDSDINTILNLNTTKFNALDVYMIAEIYKTYFSTSSVNIATFEAAVKNALKINKRILLEAQITTHATDKLLYMIDNVIINYQDVIEIIEDDFVIVALPSSNVSGIVVQSHRGVKNVTILKHDCVPKDVVEKIKNLELAVCLSPELKNQIDGEVKIRFTIFFNNYFFGEVQYPQKNVTAVFEVLLIDEQSSNLQFLPVTIVQKLHVSEKSVVSCVSWIYDVNQLQGFWVKAGDSYNLTSHQFCTVSLSPHSSWGGSYYTTHFALAVSYKEFNVTNELEELLGSDYLDSERITFLANVSQNYHRFNPNDVFLVGQVLNLVKNNSDNDLRCLAKLVSNLHKVKKPILSESQKKDKATDLILDNIDGIARSWNHNDSEVNVTTDSFFLFMSNFKNDFSGLLILESNGTFEPEVLRGNVSVDDLELYDNFSSAIVLSSELKDQFEEDSRIIITFFSSDALFNENGTTNKDATTIFGVILPESGNYSGPISVLYQVASSGTMECAHWNYSTIKGNKSYWKKDSNPKNSSSIRRCDFWHTTHFALLLLNNNIYGEYDSLDWITTINSAISLISLLVIVLTAVIFKKWRTNSGNQILLNFSFTIIIQIVTLYIAGAINRHSNSLCTLVGVLLHYSIISQFCWMLIIAVLQFKKFVQVFATNPRYLLPKACVLGWVVPAFPVVLVVVLGNGEYVAGSAGLCYPSSNLGMYLGVWLPVAVIGVINSIIFVYIMYNVVYSRVENRSGVNEKKHQWRLFILLFFMLGLTWGFGFLSGFDFRIVFTYIFCFTATLQGFVVFLYFIIFNRSTRQMYYCKIKSLCARKEF